VNARRVHAVIAAGVDDPMLIARWRTEPARLGRLGIEPQSLDLNALWKFAGLTIKVRHNSVRGQLPGTFRLMAIAGLEIGLFADYAAFRKASGQPYAAATTERTHDIVEFITGWIDPALTAHSLLCDIARHEHALISLNTAPAVDIRNSIARHDLAEGVLKASAVPSICGRIMLHEMHCDPLLLAAALRKAVPPLEDIPIETRYYCYWRGTHDSEIAVLELDEFGYYLLSLVDGRRSIGDLFHCLAGRGRPTRRFTQSLAQLKELGLLTFVRRRRKGAA
jgi:hypothetical protein